MAEKGDFYDEDLQTTFENASAYVRGISGTLTEEQLLKFYGLYKQAMEGPCTKSKPGWFQMTEKQKWQAWSALGNMGNIEAMENYIHLLNSINNNWQFEPSEQSEKLASWIHHSSMKNTDEDIDDSDKSITDWIKEGNLVKLKEKMQLNKPDIDELDDDGLGLLHWAADRGILDIVQYLVKELNAGIDITDADGQTALHYAASCGHEDVVKFLVEIGANANITDNDGNAASDVACNVAIKEMLKSN